MSRRKTYRNDFQRVNLESMPFGPVPRVMMINAKKGWIVEASLDKKRWRTAAKGRGLDFLDLLPGVQFYRVRRHGADARLRDPLKVIVQKAPEELAVWSAKWTKLIVP